ncbi:hypothetical protein EUX98_g4410 [Antrodiella citrinella]|uniref:DNA 3'-5' helicase n=1 Tax=Antrodiella citrinella TaxID=2447956 RepID=A0A4S4MU07_9APHY|nr:hypothetical protein EUX98_g4410 [Antrodiella citrinella]
MSEASPDANSKQGNDHAKSGKGMPISSDPHNKTTTTPKPPHPPKRELVSWNLGTQENEDGRHLRGKDEAAPSQGPTIAEDDRNPNPAILATIAYLSVSDNHAWAGTNHLYVMRGDQQATRTVVAMKKARITKHIRNSVLRHEACVYLLLQGHPNISKVYAWGRSQYYEYLVLELLGDDTGSVLDTPEKLTLNNLVAMVCQMIDAIQHIHSHHLIHGDIKPSNFLFAPNFASNSHGGRIFIIDFGLSKYYRDSTTLAYHPEGTTRTLRGTPDYASIPSHLHITREAKVGYDSDKTRSRMSTEFFKRSKGKTAHPWQLDAAESLLLGLDTVVIAGTGSGKTTPFMLPLFLQETKGKILVVVEPLINLQRDQVRRFKKMGISAKAVNSETWSEKLAEDIKAMKYQALFMAPEMCFRHAGGKALLAALGAAGKIFAFIVDEAHCISQWGGDFRPAYQELAQLRAHVDLGVPVMLASATMAPDVLGECEKSMRILPERAFYVNLGNDRRNIKTEVRLMENESDLSALDDIFNFHKIDNVSDIPKTLIFANTRNRVQEIWRYIRSKLPPWLVNQVDFMHSLRTTRGKRRVMKRFSGLKRDISILVATEAVGMGADIPDIAQIIQFGAPSSLTIWLQRAGRAGRDPDIYAVAYFLVEKSVFKPSSPSSPLIDLPNGNQPAKRRKSMEDSPEEPERKARGGNHRKNAVKALKKWRTDLGCGRYSRAPITIDAIIPDDIIGSLAWHIQWKEVADVREKLSERWFFVDNLAGEALEILREVDEEHRAQEESRFQSPKQRRRAVATRRQDENTTTVASPQTPSTHSHRSVASSPVSSQVVSYYGCDGFDDMYNLALVYGLPFAKLEPLSAVRAAPACLTVFDAGICTKWYHTKYYTI